MKRKADLKHIQEVVDHKNSKKTSYFTFLINANITSIKSSINTTLEAKGFMDASFSLKNLSDIACTG